MSESEYTIEQKMINQLTTGISQWTYRKDLDNEEALWQNLKKILENNNKEQLDDTPLTDKEFEQVKNQLSFPTFYDAAHWIAGENGVAHLSVQRDTKMDTDPSGVSPNWEGFEVVIGREGTTANTMRVERSVGGWDFTQTGTASFAVKGNRMELAVPAAALGLQGAVRFSFKLSDNMQQDGDILDFYKSGDVAPGGRFTFVY